MRLQSITKQTVVSAHVDSLNDPRYMQFSRHSGSSWTKDSVWLWVVNERLDGNSVYYASIEGKKIGTVTFRPKENNIDISFLIFNNLRGRGLAKKLVDTAFRKYADSKKIQSVTIGCDENHMAVKRVAEKCGFQVLKTDRKRANKGLRTITYIRKTQAFDV